MSEKREYYKHLVVITFPAEKVSDYGFALQSFIENWPKEVKCVALVENANKLKNLEADNLTILDFDECVGFDVLNFESRNAWRGISDFSTVGDITKQAAKFARKVFAQLYVLENYNFDFLHYIDSDLQTVHKLTIEEVSTYAVSDSLVSCFPRWWLKEKVNLCDLHIGFTETGYIIWNKNHPAFLEWIEHYKSCYLDDKIFDFKQWHDCIAFDYATLVCENKYSNVTRDLSNGIKSKHPIVESCMGKYFDHMKGSRKFKGRSLERTRAHGQGFDKLFSTIILFTLEKAKTFKHMVKLGVIK